MAASFDNHRLSSLACERMRGCTFAERFMSETATEANNATITGSPTFSSGIVLDGTSDNVKFDIKDTVFNSANISIVIKFKPSFDYDEAAGLWLFDTDAAEQYEIANWANYLRIRLGNTLIADIANATYGDYWEANDWNVLTVAGTTGNTSAWLNDGKILDADNTAWTPAEPVEMMVGKRLPSGGDRYEGTIAYILVFQNILTEEEHDNYVNDDLTSFMDSPYACWRCDTFGDDTAGYKIWDRGTNKRDLTKGDGATAGTFPTFNSNQYREYYEFDGSNDYVSGMPTLPATYTFTAAKGSGSTSPSVEQHNDDTFHSDLTTTGTFTGYIFGMILHSGVLTAIQLLHDEYQHLYNLWRGNAYGAYHRLITEGVCMFAEFLDSSTPYKDESAGTTGTDTLVTTDDENGCSFASATSNVEFADAAGFRTDEFSASIYFTEYVPADGTILDKGTNYKIYTENVPNGGVTCKVYLNSQYVQTSLFDAVTHIGITAKDGFPFRLYLNGEYIDESSGNVTLDDTDTTVINVGNNNEKNDACPYELRQVATFNEALTDAEIKALYQQAVWLNNQY